MDEDGRALKDRIGISFLVFGFLLLCAEGLVLFFAGINLNQLFVRIHSGFALAGGVGSEFGGNIVERGLSLLSIMSVVYKFLAIVVTFIPLIIILIGIYMLASKVKEG